MEGIKQLCDGDWRLGVYAGLGAEGTMSPLRSEE